MLTLRQALVIGLVIIAPLAFVAYLLPNTESLFKKWWKALRSLLLLYPVIALIFAASSLSSDVLGKVAEDPSSSGTMKFVMQVMAAGVQILPLFLTMILMKTTSGTLGQVASAFNSKTQGMRGSAKKVAKDQQEQRYLATKAGYGLFNRQGSNKNPFNWGRKAIGAGGRVGDRFSRNQKKDADTYEKKLNTGWQGTNTGSNAVQRNLAATEEAEMIDVDAKIKNIINEGNVQLHADLAIKKESLSAAEKTLAEDHSELRSGQNDGRYAAGTATAMQIAADEVVYQQMRGDSARSRTNTERTKRILESPEIQKKAGGIDPQGATRVRAYAIATQDKATEEAVGNSMAMITDKPQNERNDVAEKQFVEAVSSGDTVAARAATRYLASNSKGQEALHKAMKTAHEKPGGLNEEVLNSVKAEGAASGPKKYDAVLDRFFNSSNDVTISTLEKDKDNTLRLDEAEIAGQTKTVLSSWHEHGTLSKERAQEVLDKSAKTGLNIDENRKKILVNIANGNAYVPESE